MPRIFATFNPQRVVGGRYESDDEKGRPSFDVTESVCAMGKEAALELRDGSPDSDRLKDSPNAPKWVREWEGPFFISVQESIDNFFEEDGGPRSIKNPICPRAPPGTRVLFRCETLRFSPGEGSICSRGRATDPRKTRLRLLQCWGLGRWRSHRV